MFIDLLYSILTSVVFSTGMVVYIYISKDKVNIRSVYNAMNTVYYICTQYQYQGRKIKYCFLTYLFCYIVLLYYFVI